MKKAWGREDERSGSGCHVLQVSLRKVVGASLAGACVRLTVTTSLVMRCDGFSRTKKDWQDQETGKVTHLREKEAGML